MFTNADWPGPTSLVRVHQTLGGPKNYLIKKKLIKVKAGIYPYVMTSRRGWIKMVSNMQSVVSCSFASDMTDELEISEDV